MTLKLGVFRRLDNRLEGLDDNSPRALELHNRRRDALHEVFQASTSVTVLDWGDTDDTAPHEYVELVLGAAGSAVFSYVVVPGLKFLGEKLAGAAVDHAASEAVKAIVGWLRPKQEDKKIQDFAINLPDGTRVEVDAPDQSATLTIRLANGRVESVKYSAERD
jgi:hypothetical protein